VPYFKYNSKQIFYREEGKGELLILLPGNTASSAAYENELKYFSQKYYAVSLDYLGTGLSDRLKKWPCNWWEECAKQVKNLIEHLNYEKAILLGTSGGAVISLLTTILYPDVVKAVIGDSFVEKFTHEMLEHNVIEQRKQKSEIMVQFWQHLHGSDWEEVIKADTEMLKQFTDQGGEWLLNRVEEIHCPVLLTASKKDNMLPNVVQHMCSLAKKIKKSKLFINDKGGHPLIWTQPDDFKIICEYFLKTLA